MFNGITDLLQRSSRVGLIRNSVRFLNRLLLKMGPIPIKVENQTLYAPTIDRFFVALLHRFKFTESFELQLWKELCRPSAVVLDVGSNMGLYAFHAAHRVGLEGQVWAFEADPVNVRALRKGAAANGYSNIQVVEAAVTDYVGTVPFAVSEEHRGDGQIAYEDEDRNCLGVSATTLDSALGDNAKVDLIKLDIQGAEGLALRGMQRILKTSPDMKVISEFWPSGIRRCGSDSKTFLEDWLERGFSISLIDEKTRKLVDLSTHDLIQRAEKERYVNILVERIR